MNNTLKKLMMALALCGALCGTAMATPKDCAPAKGKAPAHDHGHFETDRPAHRHAVAKHTPRRHVANLHAKISAAQAAAEKRAARAARANEPTISVYSNYDALFKNSPPEGKPTVVVNKQINISNSTVVINCPCAPPRAAGREIPLPCRAFDPIT